MWRDRLRVGLCPDRLILADWRRGLRPAPGRKEIVPLEGGAEAVGWQRAVEALGQALASAAARPCDVTVVLSNHFVRYALLPWNAALKTGAEWLALARHQFESVHGQSAGWDLKVAPTGARGARIACAVETGLLEALEQKVGAAGVKGVALVSVQPYLMAAFNRIRSRIGRESCWLLVVEPGCMTMGLLESGSWRALRCRRIDAGWRVALPELLERESALLGLEEPCRRIVVHAHEEADAELPGDFHLRDLTLEALGRDERALAMALA